MALLATHAYTALAKIDLCLIFFIFGLVSWVLAYWRVPG